MVQLITWLRQVYDTPNEQGKKASAPLRIPMSLL